MNSQLKDSRQLLCITSWWSRHLRCKWVLGSNRGNNFSIFMHWEMSWMFSGVIFETAVLQNFIISRGPQGRNQNHLYSVLWFCVDCVPPTSNFAAQHCFRSDKIHHMVSLLDDLRREQRHHRANAEPSTKPPKQILHTGLLIPLRLAGWLRRPTGGQKNI